MPHLFTFKDLENGKNAKEIDLLEGLYPTPEMELHEKRPVSLQESAKVETTPNTCHE